MFHYLMKRLAAALFLLAAYAWADSPSAVAIRNAKIVTVSGPVIAKGTVVLRKGLIEAVGENVQVPADAWVVDGEGMTVYPGLIDASQYRRHSWARPLQPPREPDVAEAGVIRPRRIRSRPRRPPATTLQRTARIARKPPVGCWRPMRSQPPTGALKPFAAPASPPRSRSPTRGIFAGQGAVIDLATAKNPANWWSIRPSDNTFRIGRGGFGGGGGGGFPGSLMGIIAYVHQIYLDADHYKMAEGSLRQEPARHAAAAVRPRARRRARFQAHSAARQPRS